MGMKSVMYLGKSQTASKGKEGGNSKGRSQSGEGSNDNDNDKSKGGKGSNAADARGRRFSGEKEEANL